MKKGLFTRILPHLIAVVIFLIVAVVYCRPALEGMVVNQHDVTHWKGAIHQSQVYKETHGQYPLWTNALFSGMPAFQIGLPGNNVLPWIAHSIITLGLPVPIQFFFLACICFYFLCVVLRINPYIGIFGSLAFAYATYNPVIISVGHDTKMWSIAYMPALLGSILLIFERRQYWLGAALTALITSVMVAMNHPQIDYYFFIAVAVMTVFFIVRWLREKQTAHLVKAVSFTIIAGLIGLMVNAVNFLATYEYQKETIRGGSSEVSDTTGKQSKTGLDKSYAFSYSMGIAEPLVMMVPNMFGGASMPIEMFNEQSKALESLQSMPAELANQLAQFRTSYWGGMTFPGEVGVSGPVYVGSLICVLAIIGLFVLDGRHKWWMLTTIILTTFISWGHYFEGFNSLLYNYLPLFNKFRAPSMIMVIPQLLLPILAVLTVQWFAGVDKQRFWPNFKKPLIGVAAVFAVLFIVYVSSDFLSGNDKTVLQQVQASNQPQVTEALRSFYDGLKADRRSLMLTDIFRSLGFALVAIGVLFMLTRKMIRPLAAGVILSVAILLDLLPVDSKYLSSENYVEAEENVMTFQKTQADEAILADKSYYRVFNFSGNAFSENITSYHYNSVGGYHPAKLRIYQDLIEKQLAKAQPNLPVLNMLNTKYFIQKNQQNLTENFQRNDSALGPVWFVKTARFVKNGVEEMNALDNFNPKDTAIVQESFRQALNGQAAWNGEGTIELVKNDNDVIEYKSASASNQLAVFSEIYYNAGWKAFIDEKPVPIAKVNYVLRALPVPAGNHKIVFRFEPQDFLLGKTLTTIFTILLIALIAAGIFFEWRRQKKAPATA